LSFVHVAAKGYAARSRTEAHFAMIELFSPRIGLRDLAQLSRRMSIALSSGIEVRRVVEREVAATRRPLLRAKLSEINDAVAAGDTMAEGFARTGNYFPSLVHEIIRIGEHTGHLAEVFRHLAEHYEERLRLRRSFVSSVTMPCIELGISLVIIGIMIIVSGMLGARNGSQRVDILGLGLVGEEGFVIYCLILGSIAGGGIFLYQAMRRGVAWTEPVQKAVLSIPGIGGPLRTIALANMAWTMELTMEAGVEVMRAMKLSLASTRNVFYTSHTADVVNTIRAGHEVHEALSNTGAFPFEFLASVEVGERSGRLPEAMKNLAHEYHERARHAVKTLTTLAGWAVWGIVAIIIICMIFRAFSSYINMINEAVKM
jgi:type IV pilus assembly protein PilC